jgi:NADH:ubiquinone oxidoreductase subunit C
VLDQIQILFIGKLRLIIKKYIRNIKIKNLYYEIKTNKEYILVLIFFLKFHFLCKFNNLIDIIAIDRLNKKKRFTIIYNLLSLSFNTRIFIKVKFLEVSNIMSITNIFSGSNWHEREVWDMYGIFFKNHPDLRRLLNDYNFEGYPLKKDFPLSGKTELFYSSLKSYIVRQRVKLVQEYRNFIFNFKNINKN